MSDQNTERSVDRLSRYIIYAAVTALVLAVCWYFRSVIIYIIISVIISLLGRPIMKLLKKLRIRGRQLPDWCLAILTLIVVMSCFVLIFTQIVPVVVGIVQSLTEHLKASDYTLSVDGVSVFFDSINSWITNNWPNVDKTFRLETILPDLLKKTVNIQSIPTLISSVASGVVSFGIGAFSVVFISFFFIKDDTLFRRIVGALVPDCIEERVSGTIGEIEHLLSRYFGGIMVEVLGVTLLNFLGLWLVAGLGIYYSLGIAFMTGVMNIIPYVGPFMGGALGTVLGVIVKFSSVSAASGNVGFLTMVAILITVFCITQLFDNFLFQPFIYSTSIKASPLEIFIVLLMAGHVGGIWGMLAAIPFYTILRVIASRFFHNVKAIRKLIPNTESDIPDGNQ